MEEGHTAERVAVGLRHSCPRRCARAGSGSRGHRDLRWILPPDLPGSVDPRTTRRLLRETRQEAEAHGARVDVERVGLDGVAAAVQGWARLPDAVFAYDDTHAVAVLSALQSRGARVPDDVAVVGADDEPVGRAVTPALTTVAGDFEPFAEAVAAAVLATLDGRGSPQLPVPGVVVLERGTV